MYVRALLPAVLAAGCAAIAAALPALAAPAAGGGHVSLLLKDASAQAYPTTTHFRCRVTLENDTGGELRVQSRFGSPFDGLSIVVTNPNGRVLAVQGSTFHRAPALETRTHVLKPGRTEGTLLFPVTTGLRRGQRCRVRLVGLLSGSSYDPMLSTETRGLTVGRGPAGGG